LEKIMTPTESNRISRNRQEAPAAAVLPAAAASRPPWRRPLTKLAVVAGIVLICFIVPLGELVDFSWHSDFFSYIPLMPLITGYLIWIRRDQLSAEVRPAWGWAAAAVTAGLAVLGIYGWASYNGWVASDEDYLAIMTTALLLLLLGAGFATMGARLMTGVAFPVAMLVFMIPYPLQVLNGIEAFFQQTSAVAASGMLHLVGTTASRDGLRINLPDVLPTLKYPENGMSLRVAPECSGIHSSQVLLITSLIAGNLFLRSPWRRVALAVFVVPLAIVRNGFRIFTLGELCIHVSGTMIDSPIHHRGGPIFFALSLIPFFALLVLLRKSDDKNVLPCEN
jgi:exosortase C (VPDSG-CTERM-specific)